MPCPKQVDMQYSMCYTLSAETACAAFVTLKTLRMIAGLVNMS